MEAKSSNQLDEVSSVAGVPKFEPLAYVARYRGRGKIERLVTITRRGSTGSEVQRSAYEALLSSLQRESSDYETYLAIAEKAQNEFADIPIDTQWAEEQKKRNDEHLAKLENAAALANQKLVKEDIRVALNALATFHMSCGRFAEAQRIFISTLEYCTSPQHRLEYSQKLSVCALELRAWSLAQGQATKSRNYAQHISPAARQRVNAQADATHGIVCLKKGKYERAAHYFLDVTTNIGASYTEVVAMEDIALYGSLCAVASFSRESLKTAALRRESFHEIMQTVPGVREMISCVVETKYGEALEILQALEPWAVNDRYLSDCWDELKGKILEKIICVYFMPFVSCDLNSMALELRMPLEDLEAQCAKLIVAGKLAARIDSHRKIMQRRSTDQRTQTFSKALQIGDSYQQRMQAIIFALSVKMHGITAKCSKEDQSRGVSIASLRPKVVSGQSQDAADVHILDD